VDLETLNPFRLPKGWEVVIRKFKTQIYSAFGWLRGRYEGIVDPNLSRLRWVFQLSCVNPTSGLPIEKRTILTLRVYTSGPGTPLVRLYSPTNSVRAPQVFPPGYPEVLSHNPFKKPVTGEGLRGGIEDVVTPCKKEYSESPFGRVRKSTENKPWSQIVWMRAHAILTVEVRSIGRHTVIVTNFAKLLPQCPVLRVSKRGEV